MVLCKERCHLPRWMLIKTSAMCLASSTWKIDSQSHFENWKIVLTRWTQIKIAEIPQREPNETWQHFIKPELTACHLAMQLQIQLIEMSNEQQLREREGLEEGLAAASKLRQHIKNNQAPKSFYKLSLWVRVFVCQRVWVCVGFSCSLELRSTTMQQLQLQLGRKLEMATWRLCPKKYGTRQQQREQQQLQLPCKANRCNGLHFRETPSTPLYPPCLLAC